MSSTDSVDLLTSLDREDISFAIYHVPEVSAYVGADEQRAHRIITEAFRIIEESRRAGVDDAINDIVWEAISKISKIAASQAVERLIGQDKGDTR